MNDYLTSSTLDCQVVEGWSIFGAKIAYVSSDYSNKQKKKEDRQEQGAFAEARLLFVNKD